MQQVSKFKQGIHTYSQLYGDTGPLVYPAGFVYIFSLLHSLTNHGQNIVIAQYIFVFVYIAHLTLILFIYHCISIEIRSNSHNSSRNQFPLLIMYLVLISSRRIVSIFVLRMFNDGIESMFLYAAILLFLHKQWNLGCLLYSIAVSIKMNALLVAPGILFLLILHKGIFGSVYRIVGICATVQIGIGLPFLIDDWKSYILNAFDFRRVFEHQWSVNYQMISESVFRSKYLAILLLVLHVATLLMFVKYRWMCRPDAYRFSKEFVVEVLFVCNFIGIVFARSVHFQFYCWYFHMIPYLVYKSRLGVIAGSTIVVCIEIAYNIYPPHSITSSVLHCCHLVLLSALWTATSATSESAQCHVQHAVCDTQKQQ